MNLLVADEASTILSDICEFVIDSEHRTAPTQDSGYPYIRTPNIGRGRIIAENLRYVSEEAYIQWTRRGVPKSGDLILAREAPVGNVAILKGKMKPCLGQRTVLIRPNTKLVDPDFLTFFLLGDEVQSKFHGFSIGATVPHLNMSDIRGLKLPQIPSLHEQRIIGSILSTYDDLIENNRRLIKLLEELVKTLYREWFVHFRFPGHEDIEMVDSELGAIPKSWEVKKIDDAFEILGGGTPSTKREEYWENGDINWYTPSDLTKAGNMFIEESSRKITEVGLKKSSAKVFLAQCVMMTSRATLGVVSINTTPACTNQGFITCIPNDRVSMYQIFFWIKDNADQIISLGTGTTYKEIIKSVFCEIKFVVPPKEFKDEFERVVSPMGQLILNRQRINSVLLKARDLLHPRLISGRINVSDL